MIYIKNLSYIYDQRGIAGLHDINLTIQSGEHICLIGQNGSGKTTLLNLLQNDQEKLSQNLSGVIEGDFKNSAFFSGDSKASPLSSTNDSSQNVLDYLLSCSSLLDREKKIQIARSLADNFELTFQLKQTLKSLSSGQKQKVLLAGVLMTRPQILIMDEPFNHLDPLTRRPILNQLFQYLQQEQITVIWATHFLEEALRYSNRVIFIHYGKILQDSSPRDFITRPQNLVVAQFQGLKNIFPVSCSQSSITWNSCWGKITISTNTTGAKRISPLKQDAIIIIPESSWEITQANKNSQSPVFIIKKINFLLHGISYEAHSLHQDFIVHFQEDLLAPMRKRGDKVELKPLIERAMILPL